MQLATLSCHSGTVYYHLTSVSCLISLTRSGLSPTLHSYLPQDCLLPVARWSSVSPTSTCLRPSPQLIFGVGPRCVLNHVIHEFPGKKTIISISFNILSTSRYLLTILPCLPGCWIQINIALLFHILCVGSTSRNRRSDHQQSDSAWVGRIHSRNSWTIYDVSSLLHLHQHKPPLPYPPSPVLLRRWLPVPWPDQHHSLAWRWSATVFSYNAHSI